MGLRQYYRILQEIGASSLLLYRERPEYTEYDRTLLSITEMSKYDGRLTIPTKLDGTSSNMSNMTKRIKRDEIPEE